MKKPTAFILGLAFTMYDTYCEAVGGKAFNGDPLPLANEFFADETKTKQSNAWLKAAEEAATYSSKPNPEQMTFGHFYMRYGQLDASLAQNAGMEGFCLGPKSWVAKEDWDTTPLTPTGVKAKIREAMLEVEKLGADVRLTNCVVALDKAKNHLSDWIDGIEPATETFMDRLIREHKELEDRHEKLLSFLIKDNAKDIVGVVQHEYMTEQANYMNLYRNALEKRIDDLKTKE